MLYDACLVIVVVLLLLLVLYVYMNPKIITTIESDIYDYPIYTLTATYTSGKTNPISNDTALKRTFVTNQSGDGIFYETQPSANPSYTLAILVVKCSATDYFTAFSKVNSTVPASITSSVTPYVGVVVQYTGTMSKYSINPDVSLADVYPSNWMGAIDLTLLFANAAQAPTSSTSATSTTFNMNAIGTFTGNLPTINKVLSGTATFATAPSVTSWPPAQGGSSLITVTAGGGYGINLSCTATNVNSSS